MTNMQVYKIDNCLDNSRQHNKRYLQPENVFTFIL